MTNYEQHWLRYIRVRTVRATGPRGQAQSVCASFIVETGHLVRNQPTPIKFGFRERPVLKSSRLMSREAALATIGLTARREKLRVQ
jgi:hypothetical protein